MEAMDLMIPAAAAVRQDRSQLRSWCSSLSLCCAVAVQTRRDVSTVHTQLLTDDASGILLERSYRLRVVAGPDQGKEHMLDEGTTMVGTHADNDLVLTDATVVAVKPWNDGLDGAPRRASSSSLPDRCTLRCGELTSPAAGLDCRRLRGDIA